MKQNLNKMGLQLHLIFICSKIFKEVQQDIILACNFCFLKKRKINFYFLYNYYLENWVLIYYIVAMNCIWYGIYR